MMPLYARNVIFEKYCCARHMLEDFALKKTSKSMLKLACFFYFQVVAVWNFFPWFQVNFWVMNQSAHYMPKSNATLQLFSKYIVYCFQ